MMTRVSRRAYWVLAVSSTLASAFTATAQVNPDLYAGLRWRNVGPFHGGRIAAVTGVIGQPGTFYAGTPLGGIWKTTSAGVTWFPIFDQEKSVDSIGAIEVAPSDPVAPFTAALRPEEPSPAAPPDASPRSDAVRRVSPVRVRSSSVLGLNLGRTDQPPDRE